MAYFNYHDEVDFSGKGNPPVAPKSGMFNPRGIDVFSALGKVQFMDIPETSLYSFFQDGRITGLLADQMLDARYKNLSAMKNGANKGFDLYQIAGDGATAAKPLLWETKTWTKHGCDLAQSELKGMGRGKGKKADDESFKANAKTLTGGFIVVDIRNFPMIKVIGIPLAMHAAIGHPRKITDAVLHKLIKGTDAPSPASAPKKAVDAAKYFTGSAKAGWVLAYPGTAPFHIDKVDGTYHIRQEGGKAKDVRVMPSAKAAKEAALLMAQAAVAKGETPAVVKKAPKAKAAAAPKKAPAKKAPKKAPAKKASPRKAVAIKKTPAKRKAA